MATVSRRLALILFGALALAAGTLAGVARAQERLWRLEQPPPPAGVPFKVPLGAPGDIDFWAPNRGLLTVEGNDTIPRGIYLYNGQRWRQFATVCGGPGDTSRIAWAGPAEFWVVTVPSPPRGGSGMAVCRFKDGAVVGSWSTRVDSPDPFRQMLSAACNGPDDCWFGGVGSQDPLGERIGAFHLHWDGRDLHTVYGPQGRAVSDMEYHRGRLFESTLVGRSPEERTLPVDLAEPELVPRLLHEIAGGVFTNLAFEPAPLPGVPADGTELLGLDSDGEDLWAVGGGAASGPAAPSGGAVNRPPFAARLVGGGFAEVTPSDASAGPATRFADVAAMPGSEDAVVAAVPFAERRSVNAKATVARITPDGQTTLARLPVSGAGRGSAARVDCPAPEECWMVTQAGWIFHYSDGTSLEPDTHPAFQGTIEFRPNESAEQFVPDTPPEDDSQIFAPPPPEEEEPPVDEGSTRRPPLLRNIKSKRVGRRLIVSFVVARPARVQLVAMRKGRKIADSPARRFKPGRRKLSVLIDLDKYPTKLAFKAKELR